MGPVQNPGTGTGRLTSGRQTQTAPLMFNVTFIANWRQTSSTTSETWAGVSPGGAFKDLGWRQTCEWRASSRRRGWTAALLSSWRRGRGSGGDGGSWRGGWGSPAPSRSDAPGGLQATTRSANQNTGSSGYTQTSQSDHCKLHLQWVFMQSFISWFRFKVHLLYHEIK